MNDVAKTPRAGARAPQEGDVLVERYRLGPHLGTGGFATVHRGIDLRTGAEVALKRLTIRGDDRALRRELVALRYARVPGVVRLLDDLHLDGEAWLILELVAGTAFPGEDLPQAPTAEQVAPRAVHLLATLARLHRLGLAHQDLKPGNVLVGDDGRVHLLDLGLATARWLQAAVPDGFEGTLRYAAPEQRRALVTGDPVDCLRADLYSVGALLYEAFAGHPPHHDLAGREAWRALVLADTDPPWTPLDALRPDLATAWIDLVHALLAFDPAERPASAAEALRRLGVETPRLASEALDGLADPATPAQLTSLFHGPEPLLHLPSRAARCLFERTGGRRQALSDELQAWIDGEFVTPDGDRLRVDREGLARLEHGVDARLPYGTSVDPTEVAERLAARDAGDLGRGWPGLQIALLQARDARDADREHTLLTEVTHTCIQLEDLTALDHGLRVLDDESQHPELARDCATLVRFWRAAAVQRDPQLAARFVGTLRPFDDPRLDAHRQGAEFMERLGRDLAAAEAYLEDLRAWSTGSDYREARRLTWLGLLRYRQLRFEEAADAHRTSGELRTNLDEQAKCLCNEASCRLDGLDLEGAQATSERAAAMAEQAGDARLELFALMVHTGARYRLGADVTLDPALRAAARAVHPRDAALLTLTEAAAAWRSGDAARLMEVARWDGEAARFAAPGVVRALVEAMLVDLDCPTLPEVRARIDAALAASPPAVKLQLLALVCRRWPDAVAAHPPDPNDAAERASDSRCREVMSMRDALQRTRWTAHLPSRPGPSPTPILTEVSP